jgi:hypothetical protein
MTEYYPLLSDAVARLPDQTPEARRAVYDRARKALVNHYTAMEHPRADIDHEVGALDAAIARLEAELDPLSRAIAEAVAAVAVPDTFEPERVEVVSEGPAPRHEPNRVQLPKAGTFSQAASEEPVNELAPAAPKLRPIAPQAGEAEPSNWRLLTVASVIGLCVAGVALAAYFWRDQDPARKSIVATQATPEAPSSGKISGRIAGGSGGPAQQPVATVSVPTVPVRPSAPVADATPPVASAATNANIQVAQRAGLLVGTPDDQQNVKTYEGTVVWRVESVNKGEGQPVATVLKADIDIPEAKLKSSMVLQKNLDPTLPATHTMELRFTPQPGSDISNVSDITTPGMRNNGEPSGQPLAGVPVKIAQNWFLVGLSQTETLKNAELIRKNAWFDVPLQLANGKLAKLTFEKGVPGEKAIGEAFAAWQRTSE